MKCSSPDTVACASLQTLGGLVLSLTQKQHLIADALAYAEGTHTVDDIVKMIVSGRLSWWPLENSFLITEIVLYPQTRHLNVFLAGGDLAEIKAQHDNLIEAARLAGCSAVTLSGRRGWVKALRDIGWAESHTTMFTPVTSATE